MGPAGEGAQKLLAIHVVLEGLAAIDEYDRDFVVVLLAEFGIGVDVDLAPSEFGVGLRLDQRIFDDIAEVAALAGVDDDLVHGFIVGHMWKRLTAMESLTQWDESNRLTLWLSDFR